MVDIFVPHGDCSKTFWSSSETTVHENAVKSEAGALKVGKVKWK